MKGINRLLLLSLNYSFVFIFLLFFSCKKESVGKKDDTAIRDRYFNLENAGWKSHQYIQKIDDLTYTATEVPILYYLLKDRGTEDLFLVDSLYEANKTERVIEFTFQQDEEKDVLTKDFSGMSYTDAVKYMSFGLDKDFYAVTGKNDTIQCNGVIFERNYKIAPYQKVLLFFSGIHPDDKIQLVYKDYLFKKGTLKFKFLDPYTEIAL